MQIPRIGLGTYQMNESDVQNVMSYAVFGCNYRLIDTAAGYKNERFIGNEIARMVQEKQIERKDLFITSKLSNLNLLISRHKGSRI